MMRTPSANRPLLFAVLLAVLFAVLLAGSLAGCKPKEAAGSDSQATKELADCQRDRDEKDKYIAKLQEKITKLEMQQGGGELVVTIEGAKMTVRAGQPGEALPVDEKVAAAGVQEFLGILEQSRGAIQKCYQQALKKSSGLQSQVVSLTVQATFTPQGTVAASSFAPSLGEAFDGCFRQVAQRWTVKGASSTTTYRQVVQLKPS
jgi:hypothetical protein